MTDNLVKLAVSTLLALALISPLLSAESAAPAAIKPQPRVRLQQTPQGAVAPVEKPAPESGAVMMGKVVVAESKLPATPNQRVELEPTKFSITGGGPLMKGNIGKLPFEIGLWPWVDVMADDAKFKPARTRVDIEFLRIKF